MNFGIVLTVRLQSKRLKNKALFSLNKQTMIEQIINRLKATSLSKNIVLSTSDNKENLILKKICKRTGINFFSGNEKDLMKRIYETARKYKFKNIICCTGDNPFIDFELIETIRNLQKKKFDFIKTEGLPWGSFCYMVNTKALKRAINIKNSKDTEVWFDYILKNSTFENYIMQTKDKLKNFPQLRLTVDYKQDYILSKILYILLQKKNEVFNLKDVIKLYKKYQKIFFINRNIKQKKHKEIRVKKKYKYQYQTV
tara:strand:- start:5547 stop:6311 length:765 start_codon:yes stop_codon:yes gene_type:complete